MRKNRNQKGFLGHGEPMTDSYYLNNSQLKLKKRCKSCGKKILNRIKLANYCKSCADAMITIRAMMGGSAYNARQKFKGFSVRIHIAIVKKPGLSSSRHLYGVFRE